jgi:DnaJ-class molecular chaperone
MEEFKSIYQQKTTRTQIVVCPHCQGQGKVEIANKQNMNEYTDVTCPLCKGARVVLEVTSKEYREV